MLRALLLLACWQIVAVHAWARLGETPEQIALRYGPVRKAQAVADSLYPDEKSELHEKNGISVYVTYEESRAVLIRFVKPYSGPWTESEVSALLSATWEGRQWSKNKPDQFSRPIEATWSTSYTSKDPSPEVLWPFSPNTYNATWAHESGKPHSVEIITAAHSLKQLRTRQQADAKAAKRKVEGF